MRDENRHSKGRGGETGYSPNGESVLEFDRDEVLQYIHEMCASLAHMSRAHQCDSLSDLLQAAADEARLERSTAGADQICDIYYRSERSDTR